MQKILFENLGGRTDVAHLHMTRLKGPQITTMHTHDFYEVFLVLEGTGIHHLNRHKVPLSVGHLVVLRPDDAHCFSTSSDESLLFVNVVVSTAWWRAFHTLLSLANWVDRNRNATLTLGDTKRLGDEMCGIGVIGNPLALLQVWQRIRELVISTESEPKNAPPEWLEELRREILAKPEALLEPIGYWQCRSARSPEHLARCCRRFYGVTFSEIINQAKIERARYLLRTTDDKVITIAYDCGFKNLAHFHRSFARLTGRTPSSWRQAGTAAVPVHR